MLVFLFVGEKVPNLVSHHLRHTSNVTAAGSEAHFKFGTLYMKYTLRMKLHVGM